MGIESFFEIAVVDGLESTAADELHHRFGDQTRLFYPPEKFAGSVQFAFGGSPHNLLQMKTALSVFWVMRFQVPRPRALLGHQNLTALLERVDEVRALWPKTAFKTLHLAAAGSDTAVMTRIAEEIAKHAGLTIAPQEGDLLVRIRRPLDGGEGWEAAVRMSPRPLSTRAWRDCDWKGALNASIAQAMIQFTRPHPEDVFLNIACGSGTILIERLATSPARLAIGCDTHAEALLCARKNVNAARQSNRANLERWDARSLPLASSSVTTICADLPFGHEVGSHAENTALYPHLLSETARVACAGARCVLLTHEIRLMNSLLEISAVWVMEQVIPLSMTGLHPRIYILKKGA